MTSSCYKNLSFKELMKQSEHVLSSVEEEFKNSLKRVEKKIREEKSIIKKGNQRLS